MISRNYGGVELGYFFKRNFSLSTRNSRITTTRRERFQPPRVQLLLAPFYHPFSLFPSSSLQSGHAIPHPSPLSCGEKHLRLPLPLLDELLLIYRVPVLRLKLRIFFIFFYFFHFTQWSLEHRENLFPFSSSCINVSIVFRVQLWRVPNYFVSIFALFLASAFSPFNSLRSTVFYDPPLCDSGWMDRIYPPSLTFIIQRKGKLLGSTIFPENNPRRNSKFFGNLWKSTRTIKILCIFDIVRYSNNISREKRRN